MSFLGIAKGIFRLVEGVMEADEKKIVLGVYKTATGVAGVAVRHLVHEEAGQAISDHSETVGEDQQPIS